jgi:hypothetical protein
MVEIEWYDAHSLDKWDTLKKIKRMMKGVLRVQSVGYLIKETSRQVLLVQSLSSDKGGFATLAIPKNWIKKRTLLRKAK